MDPLWDIYMKVEAVSSEVVCSGLRSAGPYKEKGGRNGGPLSQESTSTIKPRKKTCTLPCWTTSRVLPRFLGALTFFLPLMGTATQFILSILFPSLFDGDDSGVHVPGHFAIGDTMAKSPTRYTGIGFAVATVGLLLALGYFRHSQIVALSYPLFPALLKKVIMSDIFGVAFAIFAMMGSAMLPTDNDLSMESKAHLVYWAAAVFALFAYGFIQIVLVEGLLVQQQILRQYPQKIRMRLMFASGVCLIAFFPLLIVRDFPQGMSSGDNPVDEDASPVLGIAILAFQIASITFSIAIFGLTDFASMPYDIARLKELRAIWKKSRKSITVVIGSRSDKSEIAAGS